MSQQLMEAEIPDQLSRKALRYLVGWQLADLWDAEVGDTLSHKDVLGIVDPFKWGPKEEGGDLVQYYPNGDPTFTVLYGYYGKKDGWVVNIVKYLDQPCQEEKEIQIDANRMVTRVYHLVGMSSTESE